MYLDKFALLVETVNKVFFEYFISVSVKFWSNEEELLLPFEFMLKAEHQSFNSSSRGGAGQVRITVKDLQEKNYVD